MQLIGWHLHEILFFGKNTVTIHCEVLFFLSGISFLRGSFCNTFQQTIMLYVTPTHNGYFDIFCLEMLPWWLDCLARRWEMWHLVSFPRTQCCATTSDILTQCFVTFQF